MSHRKFYVNLGALTIGLSLLALVSGFYAPFDKYQDFFWLSIAFFLFFSILTYWFGINAARSSNKFAFTQFSILFPAVKLLFSIVIIVAYKKIVTPETNLFVLPFFLTYLCYTVFETSFMMKLGRVNNQS